MKTRFYSIVLRPFGLLVTGLSISIGAQAQTAAAINGAVHTAAGAPVDYATITLHHATDSSVIKTEFSNEKGLFHFEQAATGQYLVSASQVGFGRQWSKPFAMTSASITLPTLTLTSSAATQLKGVTVVGQKPLYEREADRTIVNVEGSALAAGNTSLDVLRRAPGVTIDNNDNLALRGKQGLLVLIDGKRQPMTGTELADYLRALPADQLKNIELITNPPAKYDAQGGAGIIAINTRKDQKLGTNGTANLSYGHSPYSKYTGGLSLNHRRKGVNLFGSYNYADRVFLNQLTINREFYVPAQGTEREISGTTSQENRIPGSLRSHNWKVGADVNVGKQTVLGGVFSGLDNLSRQDGTNHSVLTDVLNNRSQRYNSTNYRTSHNPNLAGSLNFRHTFKDSLGLRELSADADYAHFSTDRKQQLATIVDGEPILSQQVTSNQTGTLNIQSAKVDYTQPLTKQLRLEAGAKTSSVTADNDVQFFTDGQFDLGRSNHFKYEENINAGYFNLRYSQPKLTLQAGLRGEQTNAVGRQTVVQPGVEPNFDRHYFQLFPSAAVKRTFSEQHETSLSLSRRIDRPSYRQLNPFRVIIDKTTSGGGNPYLRPQTSYNLELTHTFKQKYSLGLSYSLTSQPLIDVVQPETDSTVISTTRNLHQQHYYGLTFTAPVEVAKWWTIYNNVVLYYNRFQGNLAGTNLNRGGVSLDLTSSHTFTFGKGWSAELSGNYQSRQVYGFFVQRPLGQLSAGVQKSLWNRKGNVKLSVADIFYTLPAHVVSTYDNYVERFYQRQDSRVATLAFSYRFGNDKVAPTKRRQSGAEDEKRRAGGGQ
ncbi:outer membrane beta-barrel protein [Hymenobacter sp. GOD-10R]|uniref:outer membrane beta-barrel protein n=1 Tax=Hymenobacter sp. GOD-10R TaxID=3093922 RepID=UPI002D78D42D|nr:outer membrane beta-barrel protein [Hymenobacter sp. GOD-10R]WRQ27660.1 outer membrane beta-barrel protein [Hymenobacter sp. GOD-10R]